MDSDPEKSFLERVCLPFLRSAQNVDGGWGFHPDSESRVESSCWALLALTSAKQASDVDPVERALRFLLGAQLHDGSWPATPEEKTGCWVTSLACLALMHGKKDSASAIAAGLQWICSDWPRDSTAWRRFISKLIPAREDTPINLSHRGWSWTPGTSSWVEPTSFALLALQQAPANLRPASADRRQQLGEAMLYGRMCPGGGWNCGNPRVYGVAGEPLVVPTSLALLALREHSQLAENAASLQWVEQSIPRIRTAASLALAKICLNAYDHLWPQQSATFIDFHSRNEFLKSVQVVAWTSMALSEGMWLGASGAKVA
jgi:Prenyltransferase and squalene oxidase repeat